MTEHSEYFNEHDEDDQHDLWERTQEIAQDNRGFAERLEEKIFENG